MPQTAQPLKSMCPMGLTTAPICLQPCQNCQNPKPCCVFMPPCPRDSRLYIPCTGCQEKQHLWALQHAPRACTSWDGPKGAVLSGLPQASGDTLAQWTGCFMAFSQPLCKCGAGSPYLGLGESQDAWHWKPLPDAGMHGHVGCLES